MKSLFGSTRVGRPVVSRVATMIVAVTAGVFVGALGPPLDAEAAPVSVVEFYHADFNHFFLATSRDEIGILDAGMFKGWTRVFLEFKAEDAPGPGLVPVCRFFSASFAPKSSHFFTAFAEECAAVKASPGWVFEGDAFYVRLPDGAGSCAAGTMPVYRSYNGGQGGAPGHMYTPYLIDSCFPYTYFGSGCVREGLGPDGVAFCVPASHELAQQRTQQMSGGTWEFSYAFGGTPRVTNMGFGNAVAQYAPALPPRYLPEAPYYAPSGGVGSAGWDPIAGKMNVFFFHTWLQFDFDGVNATSGCAFEIEDLFDGVRGPCHPLSARRL